MRRRNLRTKYGKRRDWRQPKTGTKAFDSQCQNNGGCDWCKSNRNIASIKEELKFSIREQEYFEPPVCPNCIEHSVGENILTYCDAFEPWFPNHYICPVCDSTYCDFEIKK